MNITKKDIITGNVWNKMIEEDEKIKQDFLNNKIMNKKTLELMLKTGEVITFQRPKSKAFKKVGGAGKDEDGNYRDSDWWDTKEECDKYIGFDCGDTLDELLKFDFISNEPYSFGEPVPEGTKVEIIETGNIEEIESEYNGIYKMKEDFDIYSRQEFRIHFEEETEEMTLAEVCKELGREIKIKK